MTEGLKKYNLIYIIAAGVIVIAIGIAIYMLYRRIAMVDSENVKRKDTIQKINIDMEAVRGELKNRDEKIANLIEENGKMKEELTKLKYQIKELKSASPATITVGKKKKECKDGSCTMPVNNGVQDLDDDE